MNGYPASQRYGRANPIGCCQRRRLTFSIVPISTGVTVNAGIDGNSAFALYGPQAPMAPYADRYCNMTTLPRT